MGWRELWGSCLGRARSSRPFWVPALEQSSGTQNGRELLALPRQESQSSRQQLEPKMALNFWVATSTITCIPSTLKSYLFDLGIGPAECAKRFE